MVSEGSGAGHEFTQIGADVHHEAHPSRTQGKLRARRRRTVCATGKSVARLPQPTAASRRTRLRRPVPPSAPRRERPSTELRAGSGRGGVVFVTCRQPIYHGPPGVGRRELNDEGCGKGYGGQGDDATRGFSVRRRTRAARGNVWYGNCEAVGGDHMLQR